MTRLADEEAQTDAAAQTPQTLAWVTPESLTDGAVRAFPEPTNVDLLKDRPLRSRFASAVVPAVLIAALAGTYVASTLFAPLDHLKPVVTTVPVSAAAASPALPSWPGTGAASVGVQGLGAVSSTVDQVSMASITKVITSMVILEAMPLQLGERGPEYTFRYADSVEYWNYLRKNESALDVPVNGTLNQYQLLQGILMGSAGNYTDFLARQIWPTNEKYAAAANDWLQRNGISGITVVEPTGINPRNAAVPGSLAALADVALRNPVFAEIVSTKEAVIPGNDKPVVNTNTLLADAGVIGVKTGSLEGFNLLTAKDVSINGTPVRLFASVLDQKTPETRDSESRRLLADLEATLQPTNSVPSGTPVANVRTLWGAQAELRTSSDAKLVLWNGANGDVTSAIKLGDDWKKGAPAGSLTVAGPLNSVETKVVFSSELAGPDPWWRLTNPLKLWGIL